MKHFVFAAALLFSSIAIAAGPGAPANWNKARPASAPNGTGSVSFTHGDLTRELPLNQIEIKQHGPMFSMVSLTFLDPTPDVETRDRFELHFMFDGKPGKVRDSFITGLLASTKAGWSKSSNGISECELTVLKFTETGIAGTLNCTGMTDMSAEEPAPALSNVKFEAMMN